MIGIRTAHGDCAFLDCVPWARRRLQLHAPVHNPGNFMRTLTLPKEGGASVIDDAAGEVRLDGGKTGLTSSRKLRDFLGSVGSKIFKFRSGPMALMEIGICSKEVLDLQKDLNKIFGSGKPPADGTYDKKTATG